MSLGGKQTQTQSIDPALRAAALENLALAKQVGQLGFVPYTEATVAGLSPSQLAARQNTNMGAEAFGLTPAAAPMTGDLSPYQIYQTALSNMAPGQRAFIESMFINPMTGAGPTAAFMQPPAPPQAPRSPLDMAPGRGEGGNRDEQRAKPVGGGGGGGSRDFRSSELASRLPGGVNTRNPSSALNRAAAAVTSKPQKAPTSKDRPKSNPKR